MAYTMDMQCGAYGACDGWWGGEQDASSARQEQPWEAAKPGLIEHPTMMSAQTPDGESLKLQDAETDVSDFGSDNSATESPQKFDFTQLKLSDKFAPFVSEGASNSDSDAKNIDVSQSRFSASAPAFTPKGVLQVDTGAKTIDVSQSRFSASAPAFTPKGTLHVDTDAANIDVSQSKLSASTPAFTPKGALHVDTDAANIDVSQSKLSASTPAFTPEAGSRPTLGWTAGDLHGFRDASARTLSLVATVPEPDVDVCAFPPGLEPEAPVVPASPAGPPPPSWPAQEVFAVSRQVAPPPPAWTATAGAAGTAVSQEEPLSPKAKARHAMLERARREALPLKVRPPPGCENIPMESMHAEMPVKKSLKFPECEHLTEAALRRLQRDEPAKKNPNEEFLLAAPPCVEGSDTSSVTAR